MMQQSSKFFYTTEISAVLKKNTTPPQLLINFVWRGVSVLIIGDLKLNMIMCGPLVYLRIFQVFDKISKINKEKT